jgi:SNF2 family DNA or RNA helicase
MNLDEPLVKSYSKKLMNFGTTVNLVVCQKSKVADWVNHFNKHYAKHKKDFCCEGTIFDLTDRKAFEWFLSECKSATEPNIITDDLTGESYIGDSLYPYYIVGVINYDLIFRMTELLKLTNFSLLLDESSMIQNNTAKRTKEILKLKASNVILLSDTQVVGKYENLYS